MPFPKLNVRTNKSFGSSPRTKTIEDENGNVTEKTENCNIKLPDSENFEIQNQIAAGLALKEVNTKIVGENIDTEALTKIAKTIKNKMNKTEETTKE